MDQTYASKAAGAVYSAFQNVENLIQCRRPSRDKCRSVGEILRSQYDRLNRQYGSVDKDLFNAIYRGVIDEERIDFALNNFTELGQCGYDEFEELEGNENTNTRYGYKFLIDLLRANLSSYQINLNEAVNKIDYSKLATGGKIMVSTNKGRTYLADYVLSTMSLGVLKKNHASLFTPALPLVKRNAINQKIGFGTVNKVFLVFDRPVFSDSEDGGFQIFWKNNINDAKLDSTYSLRVNNFNIF